MFHIRNGNAQYDPGVLPCHFVKLGHLGRGIRQRRIDHFGEPLDSVYLDLQLVDRYSDGLEKRFYLSISARNIDIFVRNNWYFGVKYGGVF